MSLPGLTGQSSTPGSCLLDRPVEPTAVRHDLCLMKCTALILLGSSWLRIIWTRKRIDTVPHQNIVFHGVLKQIPWATFDRLVTEHNADWDERVVKTRAHLIAMLLAQFCGARSLREIETNLKSHAGKLYHLGGDAVSRSALSSGGNFSANLDSHLRCFNQCGI